MFETPIKRRGRGAQSNRSGRFEPLQRIDIDDGWAAAFSASTSNSSNTGCEQYTRGSVANDIEKRT